MFYKKVKLQILKKALELSKVFHKEDLHVDFL